MTATRTRQRSPVLAALLALATAIVLTPATSAASGSLVDVVVQAVRDARDASTAVAEVGGIVHNEIDLVDAAVATVPAERVDDLTRDARILTVTPDRELRVQSDAFEGDGSVSFAASAGASALVDQGVDGDGVGVALLDTGVLDAHPDLAGKVVASADLTGDGTFTDAYGHGTFMAGLVAGGGDDSPFGYTGVAPGAHLVSVKVAGADGVTTLGQVLYGLQLIDSSKDTFDTRVVLVALAGPAVDGPDPLELALERLWADGLVVVAAAGNSGGAVASPGVDPYVVTVGATDDHGTADPSDDTVPAWTARGDGKPDVVAPGTSLVSLRVPGSTIDTAYAGARVDDLYFRGSGTSMSAAVTAGAAALLLDADPSLTPDLVKGRLLGAAAPAPAGADPAAVGHGSVDAAAAAASDAPPANADLAALPSARPASAPPHPGGKSFVWVAGPDGTSRWLAREWAAREWAAREWAGHSWQAREWAVYLHAAREWAAREWAAREWAAREWAAREWAAREWAGHSWQAREWAGREWASREWAGHSWQAREWASREWAGREWAGHSWQGREWASASWG